VLLLFLLFFVSITLFWLLQLYLFYLFSVFFPLIQRETPVKIETHLMDGSLGRNQRQIMVLDNTLAFLLHHLLDLSAHLAQLQQVTYRQVR
jgi:hypothetical protein